MASRLFEPAHIETSQLYIQTNFYFHWFKEPSNLPSVIRTMLQYPVEVQINWILYTLREEILARRSLSSRQI